MNNYGFNAFDIYYDHEALNDASYDKVLTIKECVFDKKYSVKKSAAFIKFTENCRFNLISNQMNFHEKLFGFHLFDWPAEVTDVSGFVFSDNILFPYIENVLSNANYVSIDLFKKRVVNCPPTDDDLTEGSSNRYICSMYNEDSDGPVNSLSVIGIFYSIFHGITNNEDKLGGAIFISTKKIISNDIKSPIKIYNSDFCVCKCSNGGSIYLESSETSRLFEIESCFFSGNSYAKYNEKATSKGGAIFIDSGLSSFKISNSMFESNDCGEGGSIYFISNSTESISKIEESEINFALNITNCQFSYNRGHTNGGAIFISISNDGINMPIEIDGCTFVDNRAVEKDYPYGDEPENGGVIYFIDESSTKSLFENDIFRINDCYFIANVVSYLGGAIYILIAEKSSKSVEIVNTIFYKNTAKFDTFSFIEHSGYGGDIYYIFNSSSIEQINDNKNSLSIFNCEFTNSYAKFKGGNIFLSIQNGDPLGNIEIKNCFFKSNIAENGVSIYYQYESIESINPINENIHALRVIDCSFNDNEASSNGGSIYLNVKNGKPSKNIELNRCTFTNCTAIKGVGAIYLNFNQMISKTVFLKSLTLTQCNAAFGGGIYAFSNKEETEIQILSCNFIQNKANTTSNEDDDLFGGSALFLHAVNVHVNDCKLLKNKNNQIKVYNNFDE